MAAKGLAHPVAFNAPVFQDVNDVRNLRTLLDRNRQYLETFMNSTLFTFWSIEDDEIVLKVNDTEVGRFTADGLTTGPLGILDYATVTSGQTGIGTTSTALTGLSVTIDVPDGRLIRLSGHGLVVQRGGAGIALMMIRESTTTLGEAGRHSLQTNEQHLIDGSIVIAPSAGAHTYTLALRTTANTVDFAANTAEIGQIVAEDIGPV